MRNRLILLALGAMLLSTSGQPRASTRKAAPACHTVTFEQSRFTICTAKPGTDEIRIVDAGADGRPIRNFSRLPAHLGADTQRVRFAMNAGMFDLAGYPIGLHVEDGRELKPLSRKDGGGNFHLKPNGVFHGDRQGWHVTETEAFAARGTPPPRFASQSGPMLLIGGKLHPKFAANGTSLHIRNGVGIDAKGQALFAISEEPVSFGRFARLFRDALGCRDALYFDGTVSRLWDPAQGREDRGVPLGPMVVVLAAG